MRRRDFITLLGGAAVIWPLEVRSQQEELIRRIGWLGGSLVANDPESQARKAAFLQGLRELGWTEGQSVRIDYRWGAGSVDVIRKHAAELIALALDVTLAIASQATHALQQESRTIPIVFTQVPDPVGAGFVDSLARPGGNATGFTTFEYGIGAKWLDLLKQIAPGVKRVAVLRDPANPAGSGQWGAIQSAVSLAGVELTSISSRVATDELERAIAAFAPNGGLIMTGSTTAAIASRLPRRTHNATKTPCDLSVPLLRRQRRPFFIRPRYSRSVPSCRGLRRSYPQGREAGRSSGTGVNQVRVGDQPQDCKGARPYCIALTPCHSR
jgi:ABC transporter substrate binding protein